QAERQQVPAEQQRLRRAVLDAEGARAFEEPVHGGAVEPARRASFAVRLGDPREQLEVDLLRQPSERAVANFIAHLVPGAWFEMLRGDADDLAADVVAVDR